MRAAALSRLPNLYFGTMTFGWKAQTSSLIDDTIACKMVDSFMNHNAKASAVHIDTARIYAGGDSERMLGLALSNLDGDTSSKVILGTKAHPSQPDGLSSKGIRAQLDASLKTMGVASVNEYYLHQPDENNSLLESLQTLNSLVHDGVISSIGMSNYHATEVQRAFDLCKEYNLVKPTVYQGLYNPLNRCVEEELLPVLRQNDCAFVAYNPLAAGLLTGKHVQDTVVAGRFKDNPNYLPRFYTDVNFEAVQLIRSACNDASISMVEATYRWMLCHSALNGELNDGILIGASSMDQLEQNLQSCSNVNKKTELPIEVVDAFDAAWDVIKGGKERPFPYWRSYSGDMPNRLELDSGASYSAAKAK
jgi:aflatoxin B1 aldehyde reductase